MVNEGGLRVRVFTSNEHPPAHVHVLGAGWEIKVEIGEATRLMSIKQGRPNGRQLNAALELVRRNLDLCRAKWRQVHG